MAGRVHRVTMFKIPDPENQKKLLAAYDVMAKTQSKVRLLENTIRVHEPRARGPQVI